jgi:glyoxylase-like metal-dependent hydrolase (beta-lactamase superfamily II)
MINLTRRSVLTGAATVSAVAAVGDFTLTTPANAQAAAGKQAAGWYRYKVGDIEVTVVTDGVNRFKFPDAFVANMKRDDVNKALEAVFMEKDMMAIPYSPIVVNNGGKLTLIDTGTGEANFASSKGAAGQLMNNLAAAGIDPKSISTVVISHYHPDHVNGLLKADGSLAFPSAEILVPDAEHKFWADDGEMSKATGNQRMEGLFKNNRRVFGNEGVKKQLKTYEAGKEVVPGVTSVATHGHSAGHTSHVVSSGGKSVFVQADVTNVPFLFVRNPGWHLIFDQIPAQAEATRRKVYDMLAADRMMVQGFHYPFPAVAFIEKAGTGYREIPVPWSPTV